MQKWIVYYTYVEGLSAINTSIEVDAYSIYDAKQKAKKIIEANYKHYDIKKAIEASKLSDSQPDSSFKKEKSRSVMSDFSPETKRVIRSVKQHNEDINNKQREISRIKSRPIKICIIASLISVVVFALSWIPFGFFNSYYNSAVEAGVSGEELASIKNVSNACLFVPFICLAIGLALVIVLFVLANKKKKEQLPTAIKELEEIKARSLNL